MVYLVLGTVYFVFGMVYLIFGTVQLISWTRVRRRQMEGWHVSLSASRPIHPLLPACSIAHGRIVDWLDWSKLPLHTIHRIPAGGETLKVSSIWLPNLMISLILICRSPILYSSILYFDTQMTEKYSTAMCYFGSSLSQPEYVSDVWEASFSRTTVYNCTLPKQSFSSVISSKV